MLNFNLINSDCIFRPHRSNS